MKVRALRGVRIGCDRYLALRDDGQLVPASETYDLRPDDDAELAPELAEYLRDLGAVEFVDQ